MKVSITKLGSVLLVTTMGISALVGCGSNNTEGSLSVTEPQSGEISGTIRVGGWPSGDDAFEAAMDGFKKQYPNVEVVLEFTDTASYHQALQTALVAGSEAPDVAMIEGAHIAQYRDSSALTNLYEAPYNAGELEKDFVEYKWEQAISSNSESLVAIPWDIGPCSYFYRTDVFEEVGLPTDPDEVAKLMSTWDGVLEVAEKVSIPGKRWLLPDASYLYFSLFCNRDYYNEKLELQIEREGDLECLNAVIKMRENKWDMNVDMWSSEAYAGYADGSCASVFTGAWFGGFLKTDIDPNGSGHWGVTTLPGSVKDSNWGGSFVAIPKQSENKSTAWAFIEYMLATTKGQNEMFTAVDYYPAYKPAWEDQAIYEIEDPYFSGQKTKVLWAEIAKGLKPVYTTMMDSAAEGCIYSSVNTGLQKGLSAEEIRALVAEDIEKTTVEIKQQQIQTLKDAGIWEE